MHCPSVATVEPEVHTLAVPQRESLSSEPKVVMSMVRQNSASVAQVVAALGIFVGVQATPEHDHVVQSMDAATAMTAARRRSLSITSVCRSVGWVM